jgi:hypothetical protein
VPKTVERRWNLSGGFYMLAWSVWSRFVKATSGGTRQAALGSFGPLSLLVLIALWAALMVLGYGLIHFGAHSLSHDSFGEAIYFSGVTFFTLGYGDVVPPAALGRVLAVLEAGMGFGFLAVLISYVPVLYNAFSRREISITLLDSKAGSSPTAGELLRRHGEGQSMEALIQLLKEWERWSAEQLEAYLSYPILAFYRSQHDDQSWLCSLTAILDTCSLIRVGFAQDHPWYPALRFQSEATFAMGRHVIVDLAYLLDTPPTDFPPSRLSPNDWRRMKEGLAIAGIPLRESVDDVLHDRLALYEPYVVSLARDLFFTLPAWYPQPDSKDNWQTTAWDDKTHF